MNQSIEKIYVLKQVHETHERMQRTSTHVYIFCLKEFFVKEKRRVL